MLVRWPRRLLLSARLPKFKRTKQTPRRKNELKKKGEGIRGKGLRRALRSFATSAERKLRVAGHSVRLVQNNQLHAGAEQPLRPRELLDLASHDVDASVV